ncbi:MAG: RecB family exonuclease [Angustibacter sp.]
MTSPTESGEPPRAAVDRPEQLGFDGMPRPLYAATPTRLLTWVDCPRRYRMTYLDRPSPPKGPPWAHLSLGTAVHQGLADWYGLAVPQRTPQEAGNRVLARWRSEGFQDAEQSTRWARVAAREAADYTATQDAASDPIAIERTVAVRTDRLALSGRVDRVDDRAGQLVVVDYKTSRRTPDDQDARTSTALAVYAVAVSRMFRRPCTTVELHHVPTRTVLRYDHTDRSLRRRGVEVESIGRELAATDAAYRAGELAADDQVFAPRPGPRCSWCDYRAHCPQGRAAAPQRVPWAAVERDPS